MVGTSKYVKMEVLVGDHYRHLGHLCYRVGVLSFITSSRLLLAYI